VTGTQRLVGPASHNYPRLSPAQGGGYPGMKISQQTKDQVRAGLVFGLENRFMGPPL
jgi:hypothetical protein